MSFVQVARRFAAVVLGLSILVACGSSDAGVVSQSAEPTVVVETTTLPPVPESEADPTIDQEPDELALSDADPVGRTVDPLNPEITISGEAPDLDDSRIKRNYFLSLSSDDWDCVGSLIPEIDPDLDVATALAMVRCAPEATGNAVATLHEEDDHIFAPLFDTRCMFGVEDADGRHLAGEAHILILEVGGALTNEMAAAYREVAPSCLPGFLLGDIIEGGAPLRQVMGVAASAALASGSDVECLQEISTGPEASPIWDALLAEGNPIRSLSAIQEPSARPVQVALLDCADPGAMLAANAQVLGVEVSTEAKDCVRASIDGELLLSETEGDVEAVGEIDRILSTCLTGEEQLLLGWAPPEN